MHLHHKMHTIITGSLTDCFIAIDLKTSPLCIYHICPPVSITQLIIMSVTM